MILNVAGPVEIKFETHEQIVLWAIVALALAAIIGLTYLAAINFAEILGLSRKGKASLSQKVTGIWLPFITMLLGAALLWQQDKITPLKEHIQYRCVSYLFVVLLIASVIGGILLRLDLNKPKKIKGWKKNKPKQT